MAKTASRPDEGRMTLMEHLTELRKRLIISFASIAVGAIVCWIAYPQIIDFLLRPYCDTKSAEESCRLYVQNPLEPLNVRLSVASYGGIILAMPMVLWQLWRFISPGLKPREKRYAIPFMFSGVALFALGGGLAYWSLPRALQFLQSLGGASFEEIFSPIEYVGFVIKMIVAFGIGFEFPILLIFLQILGILHNRTLRAVRQYAIVGIVIAVAVITPSGDPYTLMVMSVPMYLFYEIAIVFGRVRERRRKSTEVG